jgi:hypothetical protein
VIAVHFVILFTFRLLIEDSWTLMYISAFNLLCIVLIEVHENIVSCRYIVRKERNVVLSFLRDFFDTSPKTQVMVS